ncbi:MAG: hypothetical protein WA964_04985 [Ilumatobacter sp.]|uniref:hypothetical protein n=1 Tax=Ilumatobacter sp. TaxID=1967498 RepID=UPI003C768E9F
MATSLLASGIPTEEAYRLASLVQARLLHHERSEIDAPDLVELTEVTLGEHAASGEIARRWAAWRHAKRSGRPIVIVLGGAPGVGKSTVASRLAVRLGITRIVPTDAVLETLRLVVSPIEHPELHPTIVELIDGPVLAGKIADVRFDRFERQCDAVGHAATQVAARLVDENRSMILEGVHLLPGEMTAQLAQHPARPIVVERLVAVDRSRHHGQNLAQRGQLGPDDAASPQHDRFEAIRAIQDHLTRTAQAAGVAVVDARTADDLTQRLVDEITECAGAAVAT